MSETDPQALGLFVIGSLCCLISAAGLIGTLVWFLRAPKTSAAAPVAAPTPRADEFHLSVLALALDASQRARVEQALRDAPPSADPVAARLGLVLASAQALLGVEFAWRFFGYGEKDLPTLAAAQQSYTLALEDFRARATRADEGGPLSVLTLILCTRGRQLGVDRLDTRQQIRDLLSARLRLETGALLAAELVWAPAVGTLSEVTVRERYPEMHPLAV